MGEQFSCLAKSWALSLSCCSCRKGMQYTASGVREHHGAVLLVSSSWILVSRDTDLARSSSHVLSHFQGRYVGEAPLFGR